MPTNDRTIASIISGGAIYAAGTTNYGTQAGSAATTLPTGQVKAATSVVAGTSITATTTLVSGTTIQAGTGIVTGKGDAKQFAMGTYIGTGGATAAIVATGLTTIHGVWLNRNRLSYSAATTGNVIACPALAQGTPGSFYPILFKHTGAPGPVANTVAGTFRWLAFGAKTIT